MSEYKGQLQCNPLYLFQMPLDVYLGIVCISKTASVSQTSNYEVKFKAKYSTNSSIGLSAADHHSYRNVMFLYGVPLFLLKCHHSLPIHVQVWVRILPCSITNPAVSRVIEGLCDGADLSAAAGLREAGHSGCWSSSGTENTHMLDNAPAKFYSLESSSHSAITLLYYVEISDSTLTEFPCNFQTSQFGS